MYRIQVIPVKRISLFDTYNCFSSHEYLHELDPLGRVHRRHVRRR